MTLIPSSLSDCLFLALLDIPALIPVSGPDRIAVLTCTGKVVWYSLGDEIPENPNDVPTPAACHIACSNRDLEDVKFAGPVGDDPDGA